MMKIQIILLFTFLSIFVSNAQDSKEINTAYRAEREKINELVHTKLKVEFDYTKRHLLGEAWLTLKPYFYTKLKTTTMTDTNSNTFSLFPV